MLTPLGTTNLRVSRLALGAGPVPAVMTGDDPRRQQAIVERAIAAGINWFDTAATYGDGQSERSLGAALQALGKPNVHLATKVRLMPDEFDDISGRVVASLRGSLKRLGVGRVTLLQVHNSITARRGDEPTSLTPRDILGPGGLLETMRKLQADGLVAHLGLTGIGQPATLKEVISSGQFATIQLPYHLLNPSAGQAMTAGFAETDYGDIIATAAAQQMGVFAIRVYAGGALVGQAPSAHTFKTKFFPLDLYQRDVARAARLTQQLARLGHDIPIQELALRFALSHPSVTSAIVGFSSPEQVDAAVEYLNRGPLPEELLALLRHLDHNTGELP